MIKILERMKRKTQYVQPIIKLQTRAFPFNVNFIDISANFNVNKSIPATMISLLMFQYPSSTTYQYRINTRRIDH